MLIVLKGGKVPNTHECTCHINKTQIVTKALLFLKQSEIKSNHNEIKVEKETFKKIFLDVRKKNSPQTKLSDTVDKNKHNICWN